MVILTLMYIIVFNDVSPLITILFLSIITLLIFCDYGYSYDGLLIALGIKSGACNLGGYSPGTYGFPV